MQYPSPPLGGHSTPAALQPILDALPVAVMVLSPAGQVRYANQGLERITGYTAQEVMGRSCLLMIEAPEHPDTLAYCKDLIAGKPVRHFQTRFQLKQGGVVMASWEGRWDEQDKVLYVVLREATGPQLLPEMQGPHEQEREQKTRQLQELPERIQDGFFVLDRDWRFTYANRQAETIFGRPLPQLLGKTLWEGFPLGTGCEQFYQQAVEEHRPVHFEAFCAEPLHQWLGVSAYPAATGISVFFRDITHEKTSATQSAAYEKELHAQHQRYQQILERITDAFYAVDEHWVITYWNHRAEIITGKTKEEMMGKNFWERFPQRIGTPSEAYFRQAFEQQVPVLFQSPSVFQPEQLLEFSVYPSENGLTVFYRDVTEKRKAEEELRILALVAQETMDAVSIVEPDGRISWVNDAFTHVTGFPFSEAIGSRNTELLRGPRSLSERVQQMKRRFASGKPFRGETRAYTRGGQKKWLDVRGQPLCDEQGNVQRFFFIYTDITERKAAENALRLSNERFHLAAKTDALYDWDLTTQHLLWGEGLQENFGYTSEELQIHQWEAALHPQEQAAVMRDLQRTLQDPTASTWKGEYRLRSKDGGFCYVYERGHIVRDAAGKAVRMVGLMQNITDRKMLQQDLDRERERTTSAVIRAQERERSEIGRELHDNVNQILTSVKLYQELILSRTGNADELTAKSIALLLEAINENRSLSKRLSGPTLGQIRLKDSIADLLNTFTATRKFQLSFHSEGTDDPPLSEELHLAVYRILQEQLTNVSRHAHATEVEVTLRTSRDKLTLSVVDNGRGFDVRKKPAGIGLDNMRSRAENLMGVFSIDSGPGKGTALFVQLPLSG